MDNDSFQYLSVARNLLEGNGLSTSLIYFDEHQITGLMPAPQTVFPPGYALLIAALGTVGVPLEAAGYAISAAAYVLTIALLLWGARLLRVRVPALVVLLFLFVSNANGWIYAGTVLSESLFTAVSLAALVLLVKAEAQQVPPASTGRLIFAGALLAGLSYWVRYAGLFLIAAAGLFYTIKLLRRRTGPAFRDWLLFCVFSLTPVSVLLVRNVLITGDIRGGNANMHNKPVPRLLKEIVAAMAAFLWGPETAPQLHAHFGTWAAPALLGGIVVLLLVVALIFRRAVMAGLKRLPVLLLTYLLVYLAALLYAGKYTAIDLSSRMFYPLFPVVLLVVGVCILPEAAPAPAGANGKRGALGAMLLACLVYAVAQAYSGLVRTDDPSLEDVAGPGELPIAGEKSLGQWIDHHVDRDETVIANDGQAFGYYYHRPTVGLVSRQYSREVWTEARLRQVAATYRAKTLFLFPESKDFAVVGEESPFLRSLVEGRNLPDWITLEGENQGCRIYRLSDGSSFRVEAGAAIQRAAGSGRAHAVSAAAHQ